MDFYVSHDFPIQFLSGNGSSGETLAAARKASESPTYSNSFGARFGFTFPSGMGIKTGFNISKIRTNFSFVETDGMPMDTNMVNLTISSSNTHTTVDIPLLFSYEMSGLGGFYYNVNVGPIFNMTLTSAGQFLDSNGDVATFTKGAENRVVAYKKEAGTSFYGSFGFHYVFNKTIDFVIEPNIRFGIASITLNDYPVSEKYTTLGLITGLRYKF